MNCRRYPTTTILWGLHTRTHEPLRRVGRDRPAASTPRRSRPRPGPQTIPRPVTFAGPHPSLKVLLASLSPPATAPIRSGQSDLAPQEIGNEFTYLRLP